MINEKPKFSVLLGMDELTTLACLVDQASCKDDNTVEQTVILERLLIKLDSILVEYEDDDVIQEQAPDEPPSNVLVFGDF